MKTRNPIYSILIFALLISLAVSFIPSESVSADVAALTISPNPSQVAQGNTTTIYVDISNVVNLNAYDIHLSFNPNVVQVISVSNGNFLDEGIYVKKTFNNTEGTIWVAMTQLASTPKSGSGHLISIVVQGKNAGESPLDFFFIPGAATLSDSNGILIPFTFTNGTVYVYNPTAVDLVSFTAEGTKKSIILKWETTTEIDNLGFNLYRATSPDGERTKVNNGLIQSNVAPGSPLPGGQYSFTDATIKGNRVYYYWLEDVDIHGGTTLHGPISARAVSH